MNHDWAQIWSSRAARNVGKLLSANVLAQVIGLLVYPILTRMYSPEDFGLFNLFLSIGGVLIIISTAQYQQAVPIAGEEKEAKGAFFAGLLCLIGSCLLFSLLPFFATPVANLFKVPELAEYLWLMPLYVFFLGVWQLLNNWYIRKKAFGQISIYQIGQNVLSAGGKLGFGYKTIAGGLLYGSVGAAVLASLGTLVLGRKQYIRDLRPCSFIAIKNAFHRFRNYPLYSLPSELVNVINCNIAVWIITPLFGSEATGYYGMAMLLGFTPISIIATSIYQVLMQNISVKVNARQPIGKVFYQYMKKCAILIIPSFSVLFILMPWLVKVVLGTGWEETAQMLRYFLPWFALFFFSIPWSFLPLLFEKQRINLWIEIAMILLRLTILGLGGYWRNLTFVIIAYSAVSALVVMGQLLWYGRMVRVHDLGCPSK